MKAIHHIFERKFMTRGWKLTFLTLIPKNEEPSDLNHYHPLSLCNVLYKIVTKIILRRLELFSQDLLASNKMLMLRVGALKTT
jgi:hypothetical protein